MSRLFKEYSPTEVAKQGGEVFPEDSISDGRIKDLYTRISSLPKKLAGGLAWLRKKVEVYTPSNTKRPIEREVESPERNQQQFVFKDVKIRSEDDLIMRTAFFLHREASEKDKELKITREEFTEIAMRKVNAFKKNIRKELVEKGVSDETANNFVEWRLLREEFEDFDSLADFEWFETKLGRKKFPVKFNLAPKMDEDGKPRVVLESKDFIDDDIVKQLLNMGMDSNRDDMTANIEGRQNTTTADDSSGISTPKERDIETDAIESNQTFNLDDTIARINKSGRGDKIELGEYLDVAELNASDAFIKINKVSSAISFGSRKWLNIVKEIVGVPSGGESLKHYFEKAIAESDKISEKISNSKFENIGTVLAEIIPILHKAILLDREDAVKNTRK